MNTISVLYNEQFPIKLTTVKDKHNNKPYITQVIKFSIKHINKLFYAIEKPAHL